MPRTAGVSSRSTVWCMRRKPRPRMVARMSSVQLMKLTTHLILTVPPGLAAFFSLAIGGALGRSSLLRTAADFVHGLGAHLGDVAGILQAEQRRKRGLDDVVRIRGAQRLREHVVNSRNLHDFAHRTASNHAGAFGGRLEQNLRGAVAAENLMRDRRALEI